MKERGGEVHCTYMYVDADITWSSANLSSAAIGSPPGERTKMSGAQQWESAKALGRLKGGGSM